MCKTVKFGGVEYEVVGVIDTGEGGSAIRVRMLSRVQNGVVPVLEVDLPGAQNAHYYEMTNNGLNKIKMPHQ